jgi:MoaA/NifB/PqqE/SkfB family radical SAM enzyme
MKYHILYRGPLSSCNYACGYCPFAKKAETHAELENDRQALARFLNWVVGQREHRFGVFFTPWGEALIRRWYQEALVVLTQLNHVDRAVIQTNLSCRLNWIRNCRLDRLALWTTFHPGEVDRAAFVAKVRHLHDLGVRLSVGVVGLRDHLEAIGHLRKELPGEIYLWVNAYKRILGYYTEEEVQQLTEIDPLFPINNARHPSLGHGCGAGQTSFTVDGSGNMRRCHFVGEVIGNIYAPTWESTLRPRTCPNTTCSCHIGYVHLHHLQQDLIYGDNLLERIPQNWPQSQSLEAEMKSVKVTN